MRICYKLIDCLIIVNYNKVKEYSFEYIYSYIYERIYSTIAQLPYKNYFILFSIS